MTLALALLAPLATVGVALAVSPSPSPQPNPNIQINAHALLDGNVRPGAWTAVDVQVSNDGPAIDGEMRISATQDTGSHYGLEVHLATGAKQQLTLYAQTQIFGSRVNVDLVVGDSVIARAQVPIKSHDAYSPIVAVIAEHPEGMLAQINAALVNPNVTTLERHPVESGRPAAARRGVGGGRSAGLAGRGRRFPDPDRQKEALRLWLGAGGQLIVVGGTNQTAPLKGFDLPRAGPAAVRPDAHDRCRRDGSRATHRRAAGRRRYDAGHRRHAAPGHGPRSEWRRRHRRPGRLRPRPDHGRRLQPGRALAG